MAKINFFSYFCKNTLQRKGSCRITDEFVFYWIEINRIIVSE